MIRSVNSTYSAIRRVSRSAITAGPKGRTCVHTPILGTLRRSRTYRTTSHPIHINDLALWTAPSTCVPARLPSRSGPRYPGAGVWPARPGPLERDPRVQGELVQQVAGAGAGL